MDRRKFHLVIKLISRMRLNHDFVKYLSNRIKLLHLKKKENVSIPYPTGIMIELGNHCNLHCKMCAREYKYGQEMDKGFMPLDRAKAIIDEIYPYLDSIGLTGLGETFMYPHIEEITRYIKNKKPSIIITVSTNAHFKTFRDMITPALAYIDNIQFSVDGTKGIYEKIRPGTDFNFICENIRYVVSRGKGISFMINTVIMKENLHDLHNIITLANSLGISNVNFNTMNAASMAGQNIDIYGLYRSDKYKEEIKRIDTARREMPQMNITGLNIPEKTGFQRCPFIWHHQYITWDGYYVPCCAKPFPKEMNMGNVFRDGVLSTLNSNDAKQLRNMWLHNQAPSFCSDCTYLNLKK